MANNIEDVVNRLTTKLVNFHGRRITNAGRSQNANDYVIRQELDEIKSTVSGGKGSSNDSTSISETSSSTTRAYSLSVGGILGVKTDAASIIYIPSNGNATIVRADVKNAPIGGSLIVNILQNAIVWATFTIAANSKSVVVPVGSLGGVISGNFWRLDILSVGGTFGGSDLTVTIVTQ